MAVAMGHWCSACWRDMLIVYLAGSAIAADYYLYQSELEASETITEMDNWLMAAERADSLGVDVISSSLGYNKFDGGIGDYDYKDMDGNTTLVTRAADMAAAKGMLVVVSAGNEGNDPWERITAPADGDSVLAIGGVMPDGSYVNFSSRGPTADGRIKPDVSAQALATAIISGSGPDIWQWYQFFMSHCIGPGRLSLAIQ
ncbi:MAG: S8 family serine peptidase [Owenweeksia sp.]|nr:S8 family serine peptidase [Owenweeksia sp.]